MLLLLSVAAESRDALIAPSLPQQMTLSEGMNPVIMDTADEVALFGFDPVSFHVDQSARLGQRAHLATHSGQVWLFRSEANRAAFLSNPNAYLPAFGGHDPVALAHGFLTSGDPEIFLMVQGSVLFFRSAEMRQRFLDTPEIVIKAKERWPEVLSQNAFH